MYKLGDSDDVAIITPCNGRPFPITRAGLLLAIKNAERWREQCRKQARDWRPDTPEPDEYLRLYRGALEFLDKNQTKGEEE